MVAHLALDLGHSALQLNQLHVQSGLLAFEGSHLLLQAAVFVLLVGVVALHLLLDLEVFVGEGLSDLLSLKGNNVFEGVLLSAEDSDLLLVHGKLVGQSTDSILLKSL